MVHNDLARLVQEERQRELAKLRPRLPTAVASAKNRVIGRFLRRADPRSLLAGRSRNPRTGYGATPTLQIRAANADDLPALERLASLEEAAVPVGPVLLAIVDEQVEAAPPLDGGPPLANPFAATEDLTALLRVRAEQLAA
jgi:hypothetical protein